MGKQKKIRKMAIQAKTIKASDSRLATTNKTSIKLKKEQQEKVVKKLKEQKAGHKLKAKQSNETTVDGVKIHRVEQTSSSLFYSHNNALGPPYRVLVDTNFFHFTLENKLDLHQSLVDCLLAKATPVVTDCVIAELEKLGPKYRLALKIAKDPRNERWPCQHEGNYADNCIVDRCKQHKIFIVATMDSELKSRIRKVPGTPIMYITNHRYSIERFADVNNAPKF